MSSPAKGTLSILKSLSDPEGIAKLHALGLYTVAQLAAWPPCRDSELLMSLANGSDEEAFEAGIALYIDADKQDAAAAAEVFGETPSYDLKSVDDALGDMIGDELGLETIAALASYAPYLEARQLSQGCAFPPFCERPSAPDWLLPEPVGATQTKVRLSNYVRDLPFDFAEVPVTVLSAVDEPWPSLALGPLFARSSFKGWIGYLALFRQRWLNAGSHLGEIVHSLALAPGESRNISVLDWAARQQSARKENSTASERLTATFDQKRAINEVVEATAVEHLYGQTDIDATTKTTGFGLTAGYGGGRAMSNTVGGAANLDLMQLAQLPVTVGAQGGNATTNSSAVGIGGSFVTSKGTLQGVVKSETGGSREVLGEVSQNISDSTTQNAANVRSLFSTVIVEDRQSGRQRGQTRNVTNYNHSHALTVQYYEILQKYIVTTGPDSLRPVLFLPFRPVNFTIDNVIAVWDVVAPLVRARVPRRYAAWDDAIRGYTDANASFDPEGAIKITRINVHRTRVYTAPCQVELDDANPVVKFQVSGSRIEDSIDLELKGGATYVDYDVLDVADKEVVDFGNLTGIDADETLTWSFTTSFQAALRREVHELIDSANKVVDLNGMEFNEISRTNNTNNLHDDVDAGLYRLMNGSAGVEVALDVTYTLTDQNGNQQDVPQTQTFFFSWSSLERGTASGSFSANDAIIAYLDGVADINPTRTIDEILSWFQFNKYGVTKYLMTKIEDEQVVDAIEHLGLGNVPLTRFIDPNPLGMVDNHLIFALRDLRVAPAVVPQATVASLRGAPAKVTTPPPPKLTSLPAVGSPNSAQVFAFRATITPASGRGRARVLTGQGRAETDAKGVMALRLDGERQGGRRLNSTLEIAIQPGKGEARSAASGMFRADASEAEGGPAQRLAGTATRPDHKGFFTLWSPLAPSRRQGVEEHRFDIQLLDVQPANDMLDGKRPLPVEPERPPFSERPDVPDLPKPEVDPITTPLQRYLDGLDAYLATARARPVTEIIHLPTPGVFGEAVLGRANASEFIDPYRFHNWQDSPIPNAAPGIDPVGFSPDYIRAISEQVGPEVPLNITLQPQIPTNWALPTGLTEAMTTLRTPDIFRDMSQAETLGTAVGKIADVAQAVATQAGTLSGAAMSDALSQATSLGNKAADVAASLAKEAKAPPPSTPTERVATMNELRRQADAPGDPASFSPALNDAARAETMGVSSTTSGAPPAAPPPSSGGSEGNDHGPLAEGACHYENEAEVAASFTTPYLVSEWVIDADAQPSGEAPAAYWNLTSHRLTNFGVGASNLDTAKWTEDVAQEVTRILARASVYDITYAPVSRKFYAVGLRITGYSDCTGSEETNAQLRGDRATSITAFARAAIDLLGNEVPGSYARLDPNQIVVPAGAAPEGEFLSPNDTAEGRSLNRGVLIEEFWYELDLSQVPPDLVANPISVEERIALGEQIVRDNLADIRTAIIASSEPEWNRNSGICLLEKVLRTDTQVKYFSVGAVNAYIADNIWEQFQIAPVDYPGTSDARDWIYKSAYNSPDPAKIAKTIIETYKALSLGVQRVHLKSTLSAVGDADTVTLSDWIKGEQVAPLSIYSCHLGEVTENLEWWLFR